MNPTLASLFPNASKSCRDANPDLPATLIPQGDKSERNAAQKPKKRGSMNKTESEFGLILEAMKRKGEILRYDFQGLTLRWQSGGDIIRYTPDFVVFSDEWGKPNGLTIPILKLIEVKGGYVKMPGYLERAVERFRHARTLWPQFQFELHKKTKDGWKKIL